MEAAAAQSFAFSVDAEHTVSALLNVPPKARAGCVLAHGAGAGMAHPFMAAVAAGLAERGVATLRYQFPYMERGSKRPDGPALALATVRAAVAEASQRLPQLALFAGGKSFGGRMSSQAQAASPLPGVRGIVFLGFPLHPAKQPSSARAQHLSDVHLPMLFLQGTRDELADDALVRTLVGELGARATLESISQADHSFHVPARSGRKDADVLSDMLDATVRWIDRVVGT